MLLGQLRRSRDAGNRPRRRTGGENVRRVGKKRRVANGWMNPLAVSPLIEHEDEHDYDFCFQQCADGGGRTHTTLRSLDFESSASANSATSAYFQGRMVYRFCKKRKGLIV
jgi:hypothetical protein